MLTPIDIQNRQLKQKMGGYDKKDTDDFLNEIIANYEQLYKENQALKEKITSLSEGIQYYKKMEGTLQKALVLAEKTSSETQEAAKSQADSMMTEASVKAEALSRETKAEIDALRAEAQAQAEVTKAKANRELEETRNHVRKLVQSYENYRLQFKKLAEAQIEMLESESFSIFVPELDELMNEAPSADSVMDNPGIIPINIGSPAPFVEPPEETAAEESVSNASVVEELPVSIAIPVSSTEPFTAPPADDMENALSIDLNVTSSVMDNAAANPSSLEVDLGTGAAINIPISAGAFVSPDDDIPEENAFVDTTVNSGIPAAETPMASAAESPFMDIPITPTDATVPSMEIPVTPADATVPSMEIPMTPTDMTVPSMEIPVTPADTTVPSMEIPVTPVDATVPSMEIPITPADATVPSMEIPVASVDTTVPSMEIPVTPTGQIPAAATVSPFVDLPMAETPINNQPTATAYQSPFVDPAAESSPFMDIPVSQNTAATQTNQVMPAMNNAFVNIPAQNPSENNAVNTMQAQNQMNPAMQPNPLQTNAMQPNQAAPAMNNAFVDIPVNNISAENIPINMGMPVANPSIQPNQATPAMNNAFVDMAANVPAGNAPINQNMQANMMQGNQAMPAMNNAFMEMPMQTPAENPSNNMGTQMDNPFMDIPIETPAAGAPTATSSPFATPVEEMFATEPQAAAPAEGMFISEPQAAAPANNNSMMADPFLDVGSMFDSPINDIPAEPEPTTEQDKQSVESLLDINPFNFIDPE